MAHSLPTKDIETENPNQENNIEKDENNITSREEIIKVHQNLIILGTKEPNIMITEKFESILDVGNSSIDYENSSKTNTADNIRDITENNETDVNNDMTLNTNDVSSSEIELKCNVPYVMRARKRPLEMKMDIIVQKDSSDVNQDNIKKSKKKKNKKSKQKISSKNRSVRKTKRSIKSKGKPKRQRTLYCRVCQVGFPTKIAYSLHVRSHMTVQQYTCSICSREFEKNSELIAHKSEHTETFLCEWCKLAFSDLCDYLIHQSTHAATKSIKCPECGLRSKSKSTFQIHIYTHFDKKMTCPVCPFVTNGAPNLKKHINSHNHKIICVECGKESRDSGSHNYHMAFHTGVKIFQCLYCGKGFRTSQQRLNHTRRHTDERPFSCNICGQKFGQSSSLKTHRTVHEKEKKFACKYCGKKYYRKGDMRSHIETHENGAKTYNCPECDASYETLAGLKFHIMYKHLKERPVECKLCNTKHINNNTYLHHTRSQKHKNNLYGSVLKKKEEGEK